MKARLLAAATVAAILPHDLAFAQNGPISSGLDEIIVTAQRRSETVQSVPIAISAFSGDQLRSQGISNTLELGRFVPNLVSMNNTGVSSANAFYLRGLGNTETIPTFDPPVGTYVDEIYLSRQNANNINLFDVERVEVLRGPQGTLFGRNTTGGAVNVILREPGDEIGGFAEIGYGSYDKKMARASIDLPLAESLAIKVSGYWQDDDGYARNVTTGQRLNDDDGWGVRLGIRGDISDTISWNGSYARIASNGENILNFACHPGDPTQCDGRYVTTGYRAGTEAATSPFAPLDISGRKSRFMMGNRTQTDLITSNLAFDLGEEATLTFITGFVHQLQQYGLDFYDGRSGPSLASPNPPVRGYTRGGFTILSDSYHDQFSQEVKINGVLADGFIDYVAGAFYLKETNRTDFADIFSLSEANALLLADRTLFNTTEALAGYAQADFNVTDQLKLTAGIRYTDETKQTSVQDNRASCNDGTIEAGCMVNSNLIAPSGLAIPRELKAKMWTPRFAVNFQASRDLLLFASVTRGFKSGGWNARATSPSAFLPFDPEKVWSYEAGIKSEWFERRLRANLTVFHIDVKDLQTPSALVNPTTGAATFITRNFADMRNRGVELELTAVPVEGLTLYVNAGYQDAEFRIDTDDPEFDQYGIQAVWAQQQACQAFLDAGMIGGGTGTTAACGAGIVTAQGQISDPTRVPDWTVSFGGSYEIPLGTFSLVPSVNASYRSSQHTSASNLTFYSGSITGTNGTFPGNPDGGDTIINGSFSPAAWFVNAGLSLNALDDVWQLSVSCTNCFDKVAANTSLVNTRYIDPPRRWSVNLRHNF